VLPPGSTPIRPLTGRLSLSPPSHTRSPIGSPCGSLSHPVHSQWEGCGLTTFHAQIVEWVRFRLFAGGASSAVRELETLTPGHLPFGPSLWALLGALQHLWLVSVNDVYQRFTCVNHTIHPSSQPHWCSQSSSPPHGWMTTLVGVRLHCPKSFAPPNCSSRTSW
jgi:hypothetical protein